MLFVKGAGIPFLTTASALGRSGYTEKRLNVVTKILRIMQLSAVMILGLCLHVAASGLSQQVTYSGKNVPLVSVLLEVKKQTGYKIIADINLIKDKTVSVTASKEELPVFLDKILSALPLEYLIESKTVFIRGKKITRGVSPQLPIESPPITIRGRVLNESGEPVVASVVVKGNKNRNHNG